MFIYVGGEVLDTLPAAQTLLQASSFCGSCVPRVGNDGLIFLNDGSDQPINPK